MRESCTMKRRRKAGGGELGTLGKGLVRQHAGKKQRKNNQAAKKGESCRG